MAATNGTVLNSVNPSSLKEMSGNFNPISGQKTLSPISLREHGKSLTKLPSEGLLSRCSKQEELRTHFSDFFFKLVACGKSSTELPQEGLIAFQLVIFSSILYFGT